MTTGLQGGMPGKILGKILGSLLVLTFPCAVAAGPVVGPADAALDAALAEAEASTPDLLDLTAEGPAQVGVTLLAPRHAGETVVMDHAGLALKAALSGNGALYVSLPRLQRDAPVTVTFADGTMAEAYLATPALSDIQEVAARW